MKFDVLILGGGFGGVYCAKALGKALGHGSINRIGLVADQNIMVFQPMLAEVAAASLSPLDVVNPLREMCPGANVLLGKIKDIDPPAQRVVLDAGSFTANVSIEFRHLVLALGGVVDLSKVPGMVEHGFVLKNVGDALRLRQTVLSRFEEANVAGDQVIMRQLLTFAVVGGGYSGVETAGQLLDLVEDVKPLYHNLAQVPIRVVLIHSGPFLLPEIGQQLGVYAEKQLTERGMQVILSARVTAVTASRLLLQDGRSINCHTVISTVGNAPNPVLTMLCQKMGLETIKGRIATDATMQVKGQKFLWALGDCAAVPQEDLSLCPPTAQFALRQGTQLGRNLARALEGKPLRPFHFKNLGQLASIGHHNAVAEVMGFRFSGLLAWWFWRTVYLFKLPGIQRKLGVAFDWTLELFFKRNVSIVSPHASDLPSDLHLEKGDALFFAGDPARSFYIIKHGGIELHNGSGSEKSLSLKTGDHFGEWALLNNHVWLYTAIATEPTTLISVSRETFQRITSSSPEFREFLASTSLRFVNREQNIKNETTVQS